jgi:hypothetical protein
MRSSRVELKTEGAMTLAASVNAAPFSWRQHGKAGEK